MGTRTRSWIERSRRGRGVLSWAAARLLALIVVVSMIPGRGPDAEGATGAGRPASPPTRADLAALRLKVALLESELALARSRKPYLVVDAGSKRLRYELLGATLRDLPVQGIDIDGLKPPGEGGVPGPLSLAGIVTLKEKDKDPRLSPLTPEQIEGGAADENVADALPPEAPADYALSFKQPVVVVIEGIPEKKSLASRAASWWSGMWSRGRGGSEPVELRITVHLDETAAREVYRSLLPGERLVIVPPPGLLLPDAGQETPRSIKAGRPARPPAPRPGVPPAGVPFQIPPPVTETSSEGAAPAEGAGVPAAPGGAAGEGVPAPPAEAAPAPSPPPADPPPSSSPPS